jgi:hypothetical protein
VIFVLAREARLRGCKGDARMSYGPSISLENAKKVAAAALAEVRKNNWMMAVAVVDTNGDLVYFEKMDDTPLGSTIVCQEKARSAARFKRPTKAFQDMLAAGGEGGRWWHADHDGWQSRRRRRLVRWNERTRRSMRQGWR